MISNGIRQAVLARCRTAGFCSARARQAAHKRKDTSRYVAFCRALLNGEREQIYLSIKMRQEGMLLALRVLYSSLPKKKQQKKKTKERERERGGKNITIDSDRAGT